ncbi:nickel ABC transporter substrate-binding protein [Campylobacter sp.]|uniref:nickel ABC transporter substrate-binding protein n=1 Tax=Campylobacter sp. TaxID=205 RepID=UPI0026F7EA93|nr:nickel ABC transporter substrate-binding protein [Campylobacter sp.]
MLRKMFIAAMAVLLAVLTLNAKDTLNFAVTKNVGPLNPHLYSPNAMFAQDMVYESLVRYGDDGKIYPWLAKSWEISGDGKIYTFKLRDDVVFSNGDKFDAKAVKMNFDAVLDNRKRHEWLELANILVKCEVVDEFTVRLEIKNTYEPTLKELSLIRPFRFIAPSAMIDGSTKDGIKSAVGTGAWKLVDIKQGISDTFEINEKYWGKKPSFSKILAKVIPDPNTKVIALKTGEVDLIYGSDQVSLDSFNELKKEFDTFVSQPLLTLALALNSNKFPTDSLNVRRALNMAIDKDLVIKKIFLSTQPKADFLFDKKVADADIEAKAYEFNLEDAGNLLEKDGWIMSKDKIRYKDGKALEMELVYAGNNAVHKSIGEVLQAQFKKLGIVLNLKADETTIFYKKQRTGDFNVIFNSTWGAPYDPQAFLASMRVPSHADYQAQIGLKDKKDIDEKITKLLRTLDRKDQRNLTHEILTKLHEEAIYIPITYETNKAVASKRVKNVKMGILQYHIPFEEMSLSDK